jgi:sialic acid synthase SpsE
VRLVDGVRLVNAAVGDGRKLPTAAERSVAGAARRSLHWAIDKTIGQLIDEGDLVPLRPGTGLPPARLTELAGRRLRRAVTAGAIVMPEDVDA